MATFILHDFRHFNGEIEIMSLAKWLISEKIWSDISKEKRAQPDFEAAGPAEAAKAATVPPQETD